MKKWFIRISTLLLALILFLSAAVPEAGAITYQELKEKYADKSSGVVSGKWSEEKFWRSRRWTNPYEFDETLNSCTGFTLDYEIVEVNKGNINSGKFKMEVYVRNTKGSWKSVGTFYLDGLLTTTELTFDPISIDAVAVICQMQSNFDYVHDLTVRDAVCKSTTSRKTEEKKTTDSVSAVSAGKRVDGEFSDEKFIRNGHSTYPFVFSSPLSRCTGFTLNYEITEITSGNLDGNFKFAVYVRTTSGKWKYAREFKMDDLSVSKEIKFDTPISINAVAVLCLKNANYAYSYTFSITDPITK